MPDPAPPAWQDLMDLLEPIHHESRLFARRIARTSADGDDLFHEALLRAVVKLPGLRDRACFRGWLYQIIVSVHRSRCRRASWRRLVFGQRGADEVAAAVVEDPGGEPGSADRAARALAALPAPQREAIVLYELGGCTVEEIAGFQRASASAVKSRLARGRDRLRAYYLAAGYAPTADVPPVTAEEHCHG